MHTQAHARARTDTGKQKQRNKETSEQNNRTQNCPSDWKTKKMPGSGARADHLSPRTSGTAAPSIKIGGRDATEAAVRPLQKRKSERKRELENRLRWFVRLNSRHR